jgi:hypothetical protein
MSTRIHLLIILVASIASLCLFSSGSLAQDAAQPEAAILESRVSTAAPVEGDIFHYFLKFDYAEAAPVYPAHHFETHGFTVIETRALEPQIFAGRVIRQYDYTLQAPAGAYTFSPVTLQSPGPVANAVEVLADPLHVTVLPAVDVRIESSSPMMLGDPLTVKVIVTKRKPVTITALPPELQADFRRLPSPAPEDETMTPAPPTPAPPPLRFELGDAPDITSDAVDGYTRDSYTFTTLTAPPQPGMYAIPAFTVGYRTAAGEERRVIAADETLIFVLHPQTPNLDVTTDYRLFILPAVITGALLLAGIGALLAWRARHNRQAVAASAPPLPPDIVVRRELAEIRALGLPARGEFKTYYSLVSEAVRRFLGAEFGFQVLERTTDEVVQVMRQQDVAGPIVAETDRFLRQADMVKFARYRPLIEEADAALDRALRLVDTSVEYHQRRLAQTAPEPRVATP